MTWLLLMVGIALATFALAKLWRTRNRNWIEYPCVHLNVRETNFVEIQPNGVGANKQRWFGVDASYSYVANGNRYFSNVVAVDKRSAWFETEQEARKLKLSLLTRNVCYVENKDVAKSVLIADLGARRREHWVVTACVGVFCVVIALSFLFLAV
jgi:hypothetical protein